MDKNDDKSESILEKFTAQSEKVDAMERGKYLRIVNPEGGKPTFSLIEGDSETMLGDSLRVIKALETRSLVKFPERQEDDGLPVKPELRTTEVYKPDDLCYCTITGEEGTYNQIKATKNARTQMAWYMVILPDEQNKLEEPTLVNFRLSGFVLNPQSNPKNNVFEFNNEVRETHGSSRNVVIKMQANADEYVNQHTGESAVSLHPIFSVESSLEDAIKKDKEGIEKALELAHDETNNIDQRIKGDMNRVTNKVKSASDDVPQMNPDDIPF